MSVKCHVCDQDAADGWKGTVAWLEPCHCGPVRVCAEHSSPALPGESTPIIDKLHAEICPKKPKPITCQMTEEHARMIGKKAFIKGLEAAIEVIDNQAERWDKFPISSYRSMIQTAELIRDALVQKIEKS